MAREEGIMFPGDLKQPSGNTRQERQCFKKINEYRKILDSTNIWVANKVCLSGKIWNLNKHNTSYENGPVM